MTLYMACKITLVYNSSINWNVEISIQSKLKVGMISIKRIHCILKV